LCLLYDWFIVAGQPSNLMAKARDEGCSATTLEKIFPNKWKEDPVGEYRVEKYKILFKTKFNI